MNNFMNVWRFGVFGLLLGWLLIEQRLLYAAEIQVPLHIDSQFIERVVRDQVFTGKNDTLRLNDDGTGCQFIQLSNLRTDTHNHYLRMTSQARVRVGTPMGDNCMLAIDWHGQLEVLQKIIVASQGDRLHVHVVKTALLTPDGQADPISNGIWQNFQHLIPTIYAPVEIDLKEPINQLKAFLPTVIPKQQATQVASLLDSIAITSVTASATGIDGIIQFEAPTSPTTTASIQEPMLTHAEQQRLQHRLEALDAFTTFIVKSVAKDTHDSELTSALLNTLIDLRYDLFDALSITSFQPHQDPVRQLFIHMWQQLGPLLRQVSPRQDNQTSMLHYLAFITAADALQAMDNLGPALNIDISLNGLRRLARILIPHSSEAQDPLNYSDHVDPGLRKELGFRQLSLPLAPQSHLLNDWLDFFFSKAWAANKLDKKMVKKLNNWVPKKDDMETYLPMVNQVLSFVINDEINSAPLDQRFHDVFQSLVYATAWQESCWRQFVNQKGKRMPLRSGTGDVGIMQINPRVWRGFYDLHPLKWDLVYNAQAGTEILLHYLQRYAIRKKEHTKTGKLDNLARATYSAYNGGPSQLRRYRTKSAPKQFREVDKLFYKKYQAVKKGDQLAVRSCYSL